MTTPFRSVDFDQSRPIDEWPAEAIEAVMDRGSLSDWRELADAIRDNPWGPAARTVESVITWGEHYGVDAVMERVIRHARVQIDLQGRQRYARQIRRWRQASGLTLRELARAAGTSPSRLSNYENARVAPTTDVLGRIRCIALQHRKTR